MRKICRNIGIVMLALLMTIGLLPDQAYARTFVDLEQKASLIVNFDPDQTPATGTEFRLYRVADITKVGDYTLTENFDDYDIVIENMDEAAWNDMTVKLQGYISADQIQPDYSMAIGESAVAAFTDIELGLYFVSGDSFYANSYYYVPQSFIVSLPTVDSEDAWQYEVVTTPKHEATPELISLEILKVWKDADYSGRPSSIEVEVYEGDELYQTVTLNADNNWRYELTDLFGGSAWSVVEKDVPDEYEVSIEKQTERFVVTNTRAVEEEPDPDPVLPQTGILWWPVPVLAAAGLLLIIFGYVRRSRGN